MNKIRLLLLFTGFLTAEYCHAQNANLCGIWDSQDYGCVDAYGKLYPVYEIFVISIDGKQITATKIKGDNCVTTGQVTWQGTDSSYYIYNSPTDSFKVFSATIKQGNLQHPNCCSTKGWISVTDSAHIGFGIGSNAPIVNFRKLTCHQLDSMHISPVTYGATCVCNNLPLASFSTQANTFCPGTCINFTNHSSNADIYKWYFPGATPDSSVEVNPTGICYSQTGKYDVTLIANKGALNQTTVQTNYITILPNPEAGTIHADDSVCSGAFVKLSVLGNSNPVQWQSSLSQQDFEDISGANDTIYTSKITQTAYYRTRVNEGNCSDTSVAHKISAIPTASPNFYATRANSNPLQVSFNSDNSTGVTFYNWDFGDNTATDTNRNTIHEYASLGIYRVCLKVFNLSNCTASECKDVDVAPVGIEKIKNIYSLQLSPNPSYTFLNIYLKEKKVSLCIHNLLGQKVSFNSSFQEENHLIQINVSGFSNGIYFLQVKSEDEIREDKFIVQH